ERAAACVRNLGGRAWCARPPSGGALELAEHAVPAVVPWEIDERKLHQGIFFVCVVRIDFPSHGELTSVRLLEHRAGSSA
ncbi:MAG: hypothetical protein VW622_13960, partial [Opitutae bacterium]